MKKFIAISMLVLSAGVFAQAADTTMPIDQMKKIKTDNLDQRITALTAAKTCVAAAKDHAAMKACYATLKTERQNMKTSMKAQREAFQAQRKAMKANKTK